ncbi:MAG: TolC family protein [Candidatus Omnitrophica bacterium]|nr:TolC family protein [Candidatus Omnitrophota bacterium]
MLISLTLLAAFYSYSFAAQKKDDKNQEEMRAMEIEKAIFIASAAQDRVLRIGLVDCVAYALKNNSEVKIERIEPKLRDADIKIAQAVFEPSFAADFAMRENKELVTSSLQGAGANTYGFHDTTLDASVGGKLATGAEYELEFFSQRYKSSSTFQALNPYYAAEPKITITQPLFRGAGIFVNRADITIARNNKRVSEEAFKDKVMDVISQAKTAYYNYAYSLESHALTAVSLERAQDLLKINKARYEKGLLSSVDLLETETAVADREKALLSAEAGLRKAEDDLKLITSLVDDPEAWNAKVELIGEKPQFKEEKKDLVESLKSAFVMRPDYNSRKVDLKNRDIRIATAKNALFPTLDLVSSFGLNGLGKDYQKALQNAEYPYTDWSAGFKLEIPWGGGERASFDQRNLEKAQALLSFKRLEQQIILEIRDRVRAVQIQARQVAVSSLAMGKESQNYAAQKERYAAGQVSTHDMIDYQEKLSSAELDYLKSLIDYNIALINLDRSEGATLVKNDVKLEEG